MARDGKPPPKLPANWPADITYLTTPMYTNISPRQRQALRTQPEPSTRHGAPPPLPEVPPTLRFGASPLVEIRLITDPAHPARGQRGLFAARALAPGAFVVPYLGEYHPGTGGHGGGRGADARDVGASGQAESDYDLWLDRDADVAVDAARAGNEARFVNDYRGTGRPRPNAEFREVWDPRRGERCMAVYVLPLGKRAREKGGAGIAKGEEILVSYGKGFWEMRRQKERKDEAAEAVGSAADALAELKVDDGAGKGRDAPPPALSMSYRDAAR